MTAFKFHDLPVSNITPEAAGAVAITFQVPEDLRNGFNFKAGQFLTLRASIDGNVLELRPKEFRLLLFLARSKGRIFSRGQLLEHVWDMGADMGDRTVDAYVQRLRSVLKQSGLDQMIETVRGMGYCLSEPHA